MRPARTTRDRRRPAQRPLALLAAALAPAVPAQSLLVWDQWRPWNAPYVTQLTVTETSIGFVPFAPGPAGAFVCGIEQDVTVPAAGRYQLHFLGAGGVTGTFLARWTIDGQALPFESRLRQRAWSFDLPAGTHTLRLATPTSNLTIDAWSLQQPVLRPVVEPTIEIDLVAASGGFPSAWLATPAHIVLVAPRRLAAPLPVPGFAFGLELDPASGMTVLLSAPSGGIGYVFPLPAIYQQTLGPFYLQAVSLEPVPAFGARLYVERWVF